MKGLLGIGDCGAPALRIKKGRPATPQEQKGNSLLNRAQSDIIIIFRDALQVLEIKSLFTSHLSLVDSFSAGISHGAETDLTSNSGFKSLKIQCLFSLTSRVPPGGVRHCR